MRVRACSGSQTRPVSDSGNMECKRSIVGVSKMMEMELSRWLDGAFSAMQGGHCSCYSSSTYLVYRLKNSDDCQTLIS
jgi:hypothetical protein